MIPIIEKVSEISPENSIICIMGSDTIPSSFNFTNVEKEYIKRCQADEADYILINSYVKIAILVKEKKSLPDADRKEELRKAAVKVGEELKKRKQLAIVVNSYEASEDSVEIFTEGLMLGQYQFIKYKSKSDSDKEGSYPETILIEEKNGGFVNRLTALMEAVYFARDRVNEPLSHLSAITFSKEIEKLCKDTGLVVDTLTKKRIEALKMGGIMAVNRGSIDPPTLSVIEWKPGNATNSKPVVLIGKGVVFDSGGLNLKPTDYIEDMKSDMAGGAAVSAVMYYIARTGLPLHVMAFVPATDNRPGEDAYAPGDVITMFNGKTVEVLNTDAEGRLILADALSYAEKYNPSLVISVATLTGSASNTFGSNAIAAMGNADSSFMKILSESGFNVQERIAELPFWKEYGEELKSDIADLKNIGGRQAGAITAGKFLENFTGSPYIHLDIAGTAWLKKAEHYRPKGGTGSGVRLLSDFLGRVASGSIKL